MGMIDSVDLKELCMILTDLEWHELDTNLTNTGHLALKVFVDEHSEETVQ
jgi:hypothetical protein